VGLGVWDDRLDASSSDGEADEAPVGAAAQQAASRLPLGLGRGLSNLGLGPLQQQGSLPLRGQGLSLRAQHSLRAQNSSLREQPSFREQQQRSPTLREQQSLNVRAHGSPKQRDHEQQPATPESGSSLSARLVDAGRRLMPSLLGSGNGGGPGPTPLVEIRLTSRAANAPPAPLGTSLSAPPGGPGASDAAAAAPGHLGLSREASPDVPHKQAAEAGDEAEERDSGDPLARAGSGCVPGVLEATIVLRPRRVSVLDASMQLLGLRREEARSCLALLGAPPGGVFLDVKSAYSNPRDLEQFCAVLAGVGVSVRVSGAACVESARPLPRWLVSRLVSTRAEKVPERSLPSSRTRHGVNL
jgi:hypothetical protein